MTPSVLSWRRQMRATLIAGRQAMTPADRKNAADAVAKRLDRIAAKRASTIIGLYWPIKGEINLLPWARGVAHDAKASLCLPVVVAPKSPLEFWRWTPGEPMQAGLWNIPVPVQMDVVTPDLVLAPLVGFDSGKYRLGYGGGYFDRTLAASKPRPFAVGVGYDFSALETIFPQPHDIPMDAILTEHREMLTPRE